MLLILLGAAACLLWMEFAALAQGSNGLEQPVELWVADQVGKRKLVNFDDRCGKTLDPIKGDDVHWADPCRTIAATDLRKIILAEDSYSAGVRLVGIHVTGTLDLSDAEIKQPLVIRSSRFDGAIDLTQARLLRTLDFQNTRLEEFNAGGLHAEKTAIIYFTTAGPSPATF